MREPVSFTHLRDVMAEGNFRRLSGTMFRSVNGESAVRFSGRGVSAELFGCRRRRRV